MSRVFVLDTCRKPLMPCLPARARELLRQGKALIFSRFPFTLILKQPSLKKTQPIEVKIDPGSKVSGIALVACAQKQLIWGANLYHRGEKIKHALLARRALRRSRRFRKTRYRQARFLNRKKRGLPPSLQSRVDNVCQWIKRIQHLAPISSIAVEIARFDMQKLDNPEISGVEYQQGTLFGYEIREYLLEKWGRKCVYCNQENIPLEIDHLIPKSKGGSNRLSNLVIACRACNQEKSNRSLEEYKPQVLQKITKKSSLKDAAAVNATRNELSKSICKLQIPTSFWSGGRTKFNRISQGYQKDHWIDAACVGESGNNIEIPLSFHPLQIEAMGRGTRQACRVNAYGFPRTKAKSVKRVYGFQTGDLVNAKVLVGKKAGCYSGRIAIRTSGYFNIKEKMDTIQGIHARYCKLVQHLDGYNYYFNKKGCVSSPPKLKIMGGVSTQTFR